LAILNTLEIPQLKSLLEYNLINSCSPYSRLIKHKITSLPITLPKIETKHETILRIHRACGSNGVFKVIFLEKLYEGAVYSELEIDKLKKLIKRLKTKGHDIYSKDKFYFLKERV
tara:strand:+ start:301 stop:645 length:345 start_codon:yes stop_codon:yes gene_type:complete